MSPSATLSASIRSTASSSSTSAASSSSSSTTTSALSSTVSSGKGRAERKRQKVVRFETTDYGDVKTYRHDSPHSRNDLIDESLWWSPIEFHCIRASAQMLTSSIRNGDDHLDDNHNRKTSYRKSLSKAYRLSQKNGELPRNCREDLAFWINLGVSRRGLEKFMVDEMKRDRERKREKAYAAVKAAQEKAIERRVNTEQTANLVAAAYQSHTKWSGKFARVLGVADEYAAGVERHGFADLAKRAPKALKPVGSRVASWRRRKYSPAA